MADPDPMEGGRTICLCLHRVQVDYLRQSLGFFISGLENDISSRPDDPKVETWKAERNAYRRLDEGLKEQEVVADDETGRLIRNWAAANDRSEEFHRSLFEHQALASLRQQIEAGL
jgi:hypothetical protein